MRTLLVLLLLAPVACRAPRTGTSDRNVIRAPEIASVEAETAYDIVAKLRAEFLRSRGPASASRGRATERPIVTLFVDGVERGPADPALRYIPASEVLEIRMYRAADATTKYGTRQTGGVLELTTRRTPQP